MVDVLRLVSGERVTATDPGAGTTLIARLSSGEIITFTRSSASQSALDESGGELVAVTLPADATVDCVDLIVCTQSGSPTCGTPAGCNDPGEQHRVEWDHTGCVDASHHIAIQRSINGGSFVEVADNLGCNNADPDPGCCVNFGSACGPDGQALFTETRTNVNSQTTDYAYRVQIENDGTHAAVDAEEDSCTNCGGDDDCAV